MAIGLVLLGVVAGLFTSVTVLVLGGELGDAGLAYIFGGFVGMLGGLASPLVPRRQVAVMATQDKG